MDKGAWREELLGASEEMAPWEAFWHLRSGWLDREGSGTQAQDTAGGHRSCAPRHILGADLQDHGVPKKTGRLGPR